MGSREEGGGPATRASVAVACFPYTPSPTTGRGVDRIAYELVEGLRPDHAPIEVIDGGGRYANPLEFLRQTVAYVWRSARTRASVVHALDPLGALPFLVLRRKPLAVTVHDLLPFASPHLLDPDPQRLRFYGMRFVIRWCLVGADRILVPFEGTRARLRELDPACEAKTRVVPYGLTPPRSTPSNGELPRLPAPGTLLFIGGAQPFVRGGLTVLRALARMTELGAEARLTFVGSGPQLDAMRREAGALRVGDRVEFVPAIPEGDLLAYFRRFQVFVYPSELGFSLLVLQSLFAGTPVVTSDARDLEEFLSGLGSVCRREDVDAFAHRILEIQNDPELRAELARGGVRHAAEFTADRMAQRTWAEYANLANQFDLAWPPG
jgi:glycosyltransferase involved in cell wall biosynthesis